MQLAPGASPISNTGRTEFLETIDNGSYHGYPRDWFLLSHTDVRLRSEIATEIDWNLEEEINGWMNINAPAQRLTIDGTTYDLYPGFWCSTIPSTHADR